MLIYLTPASYGHKVASAVLGRELVMHARLAQQQLLLIGQSWLWAAVLCLERNDRKNNSAKIDARQTNWPVRNQMDICWKDP